MTQSSDDSKWGKGQKTAFQRRMEDAVDVAPLPVGQQELDPVEAERRFRNRKMRAAIRRQLQGVKFEELAQEVILETMRVALFDPRELFNADGRPKDVTELDADCAAAIAGLELETERIGDTDVLCTTKKFKLADKLKALEMLGRWLKLYAERMEITGVAELADELAKARKRAQEEKQ